MQKQENAWSTRSGNDIFLNSVETELQVNDCKVNVKILKKNVNVKLDTGAQCNVLPLHVYKQISNKPLQRSKSRLVSYSGHRHRHCWKSYTFSIIERQVCFRRIWIWNKAAPIFGLQTCTELNLISRLYGLNKSTTSEEILENFNDVFEGIGCLSTQYKIQLDKDAKSAVHPPRKIPFALKNKVKNELSRLESMRVIQKVSEPTEWVNSLVVVEKPNKDVRLCLVPIDLNKNILREHYPMKTVEEVAAKVNNAKVYSVIDASNGYWQIKLSKVSQKYTTFNTPFGRYKYLRLPFGIKSSSEVFQRTVSQIIENLDGCEVIAGDILIWGKTHRSIMNVFVLF